jgi:1-aminocyclopropane-1-carboxylate deaminase/D-cysteine desulfhydrase-like pyridoxal-dependent ACC family enzyme
VTHPGTRPSAAFWPPGVPPGIRRLPRFPLLDGPTPLMRAPRFSAALGDLSGAAAPDVWIKREDLAPIGLGGNKLRNLESHLGRALADGADVIVTSGRRWSNHCRLTAAAGAVAGLGVELVLTGPRPAQPGPSQQLAELFGARIHFTDGPEREEREALTGRLTGDLRERGRRPYLIPVGGSALPGAAGQLLAGLELAAQLEAAGLVPDLLVLATATGGTQAGLITGLGLAGRPIPVLGFCVARPAAELRPVVDALSRELRELSGLSGATPAADLDDSALGAGYGRRSPEADEATALLARTEGILADPIYTAKALAGLVGLARTGRLAGRSVVFWHGGGTTGLFEDLEGGAPR